MLISFHHMWAWRCISMLSPSSSHPSVRRITICYNHSSFDLTCHLMLHIFSRDSVMNTLMVLVRLIPHCRHTQLWYRDPRYNIYNWQWAYVCCGPFALFWNQHIGEENPSWYLSRQPIIITHLCLLIVRSFPAVQDQVGGLWLQVQAGLSWPWDTQEVQSWPHGGGMLWLLIRLCMAWSLGIRSSKDFHGSAAN